MQYPTRYAVALFAPLLLLGCEERARQASEVEKSAPAGDVARTSETKSEASASTTDSGKTESPTTTAAAASTSSPSQTFARTVKPAETVAAPAPAVETQATGQAGSPEAQEKPRVEIDTSMGRIVLELDPAVAPITVENFLRYVDEEFYTGTIFHRVINGFMIQGGGFTVDGLQKPTHSPIKNESEHSLRNTRGTISMARTRVRDSATAQFFINLVNNPFLDYPNNGGYAAFGRVVEGMDVVDKIAQVPVAQTPLSEAQPLRPVVINAIRRLD